MTRRRRTVLIKVQILCQDEARRRSIEGVLPEGWSWEQVSDNGTDKTEGIRFYSEAVAVFEGAAVLPEAVYLVQQAAVHALVPQFLPNIHRLASFHLRMMPNYTPAAR